MIHPLFTRIGRTRVFGLLAPHVLPRLDLMTHRLTGRRWMPSRWALPSVLLTTTGHRTGIARTTPLCAYQYEDGSWLIAATNFGRPRHPSWSTNLLHHPQAVITADGRAHHVAATLLSRDQIAAHRPQILRILPVFDHYAARAGP